MKKSSQTPPRHRQKTISKVFLSAAFSFLFLTGKASADESETNVTETSRKYSVRQSGNALSLGIEGSIFKIPDASIAGMGFGIHYRYALGHRFALRGTLSQAFTASGGFGFLYTNVGLFAHYAIRGGWSPSQTVYWDHRPMVTVKERTDGTLSVFSGIEQYIFSGKAAVYPAPGLAAGLDYQSSFFGRSWTTGFKAGVYSADAGTISALILQFQTSLE
jgi:hypothetical protein